MFMEAKKKSHPKASVVVAKKTVRHAPASRPPLKSARGIVALLFTAAGAFALLSMLLWTHFPSIWKPLVVPGQVLLSVFSWAAYYLPLWLVWAGALAFVPKFCPRSTYLLGISALPFVVVTGFARLSSNPGAFFESHPSMAKVGLSSLYAALGFLLAASFVVVIAGYIKLSEWLKANGYIKTRAQKKKNGTAQSFGQKLTTFLRNVSMKRKNSAKRKEKARLGAAEALAEKNIFAQYPRWAPRPLKSRKRPPQSPWRRRSYAGARSVPGHLLHLRPSRRPAQDEEPKRAIVERILEARRPRPITCPSTDFEYLPDASTGLSTTRPRHAGCPQGDARRIRIEAEVTGSARPRQHHVRNPARSRVKISKFTNRATTSPSGSPPPACASSRPSPASTPWASKCRTSAAPSSPCANSSRVNSSVRRKWKFPSPSARTSPAKCSSSTSPRCPTF
jgi:hypothetical protein